MNYWQSPAFILCKEPTDSLWFNIVLVVSGIKKNRKSNVNVWNLVNIYFKKIEKNIISDVLKFNKSYFVLGL